MESGTPLQNGVADDAGLQTEVKDPASFRSPRRPPQTAGEKKRLAALSALTVSSCKTRSQIVLRRGERYSVATIVSTEVGMVPFLFALALSATQPAGLFNEAHEPKSVSECLRKSAAAAPTEEEVMLVAHMCTDLFDPSHQDATVRARLVCIVDSVANTKTEEGFKLLARQCDRDARL